MLAHSLYIYIFLTSLFLPASAFTFTTTTNPTECDDFTLSWTGGSPPFYLLLSPVFGTPRNISIPGSAFSDGKGSFTTALPFPNKGRFFATMSDSTGFASGGTTTIFNVGPSQGGSCNSADPGVDFTFELNDGLDQCRDYRISGYTGAIQPVTIFAIIPGGESVVIHPPVGPTSYTWVASVFNGTSIVFVLTDSQGRQGGSSDIKQVGSSDDLSCINDSSPSSTIGTVEPTTTAPLSEVTTSAATSESTTAVSSGSSTPIGAIAGTVLGALLFLAVMITLGLFFLRRRQQVANGFDFRRRSKHVDLSGNDNNPYSYPLPTNFNSSTSPFSPYPPSTADLTPQAELHQLPTQYAQPHNYQSPSTQYSFGQPNGSPRNDYDPFDPPVQGYASSSTPSASISPFDPSSPSNQSSISAAQRKAGMAGASSYKPSRFILHTDIDDDLPPANEDGVVELPPQYSERRNPAAAGSVQGMNKSRDPFNP